MNSPSAAPPSDLTPMVLVHGAGGGGWEWRNWLAALDTHGRRMTALDLHPTAEGLEATDLAHYATQVDAASRKFGEAVILVGASIGGLLCAMAAPKVVPRAMVLVNPMPPAPFHTQLTQSHPHPAIVPWGRDASIDGTRRSLPDSNEETVAFAASRWRDESGLALNSAFRGIVVDRPTCPTLVIAGGNDEDIPPGVSRGLATAWEASFVLFPGMSHVGPLLGRKARVVAAMVDAWLAAVDI